jgi:hypothetical protein
VTKNHLESERTGRVASRTPLWRAKRMPLVI